MTWKEFKAEVEADGVTDETVVLYIDVDLRCSIDWSVRPFPADQIKEVAIW